MVSGVSYGFELAANGEVKGTFAYGNVATLILPSNNESFTITVSDLDNGGCIDSTTTNSLHSCSAPCDLPNGTEVEIHCNNATTEEDGSDDYYSVTFFAASPSQKAGYRVIIDGIDRGIYPYNLLSYYNMDADSLHHTIKIADVEDSTCYFNTTLGRFVPCSGQCKIEMEDLRTQCNDMGSPYEISDDSVKITFTVKSLNVSGKFMLFIDGLMVGHRYYNQLVTLSVKASGQELEIKCIDNLFLTCVAVYKTAPLNPCSIDCNQVNFPVAQAGEDRWLTCLNKTVLLKSENNLDTNFIFTWTDKMDIVVGHGFSLEVSDTGQYFLTLKTQVEWLHFQFRYSQCF